MIPDVTSSKVRWREVVLFSALAYALSWGWWAQLVLPRIGSISLFRPLPDLSADPRVAKLAVGMFGPLVAALIMRLFVSKEGLKGSLGLLTSWRWFALAVAGPAVFVAGLIAIDHVSSLGRFEWTGRQPFLLAYVIVLVLNGIIGIPLTLGEEYGWRGYLLPRMLPLGEVRATLIVGAIWSAWHLPALMIGLNYVGEPLWAALVLFAATTLLLSFPFTWLYVASRSVLVVAIMHALLNAASDAFAIPKYMPHGRPVITGGGGLIMIGMLLAVVVIAYLSGRCRRGDGGEGRLCRGATPIGW